MKQTKKVLILVGLVALLILGFIFSPSGIFGVEWSAIFIAGLALLVIVLAIMKKKPDAPITETKTDTPIQATETKDDVKKGGSLANIFRVTKKNAAEAERPIEAITKEPTITPLVEPTIEPKTEKPIALSQRIETPSISRDIEDLKAQIRRIESKPMAYTTPLPSADGYRIRREQLVRELDSSKLMIENLQNEIANYEGNITAIESKISRIDDYLATVEEAERKREAIETPIMEKATEDIVKEASVASKVERGKEIVEQPISEDASDKVFIKKKDKK